eukprot:COSAG02_NODE_418_length_22698_cov_7.471127_4_plen_258_part_00
MSAQQQRGGHLQQQNLGGAVVLQLARPLLRLSRFLLHAPRLRVLPPPLWVLVAAAAAQTALLPRPALPRCPGVHLAKAGGARTRSHSLGKSTACMYTFECTHNLILLGSMTAAQPPATATNSNTVSSPRNGRSRQHRRGSTDRFGNSWLHVGQVKSSDVHLYGYLSAVPHTRTHRRCSPDIVEIEIYESEDCKTLQQAGYSRQQLKDAHSNLHSLQGTLDRWTQCSNTRNSMRSSPPEDDDDTTKGRVFDDPDALSH